MRVQSADFSKTFTLPVKKDKKSKRKHETVNLIDNDDSQITLHISEPLKC